MAAQAALIADTIVGMKRALRKENDYTGPDDPITQPTNRGNKLRANARYVREGALGSIYPDELYKQKIEHAGYTRYVLQRNPVRYDSEGDELDDDDEDSDADAAAAEENPFSEIALENLLCPLKHPSELPTHPSLSHAYTSKALWNMAQAIEAKLRQERAILWRARNLYRHFLGDISWVPCGRVETAEDRGLFEPRLADTGRSSPMSTYGLNGVATQSERNAMLEFSTTNSLTEAQDLQEPARDVEMVEAQTRETEPDGHNTNNEQAMELKSEEIDASVVDLPQHPGTIHQKPHVNGDTIENAKPGQDVADEDGRLNGEGDADLELESDTQGDDETDTEMQDGSSPEPPRRMTTRARANAANSHPDDDSGNLSPSPSTDTLSTLPTPHPLFLAPEDIRPDPNFGLPPGEAEDTRRVLWSYIQKQEETVRGFEHMLECLLRACRMKDDVLEWCKAEGHVGEMSDGEDWYDREKWGLGEGEDLKKGVDEDEIETVEESRATGKRGRGRRA